METVPDSILDRAHEIQLVDLSVEKLMDRLGEGKVYLGERAEAAAAGFFREGNLTALRELALRFTAERVDRDLEDIRKARRVSSPWKTNARLMVGVGPDAVFGKPDPLDAPRVGPPRLPVARRVGGGHPAAHRARNRTVSRAVSAWRARLGAEVVHATGDDVAAALLRSRARAQCLADRRRQGRTAAVVWKPTSADRIIAGSGDIDVCVVAPADRQAVESSGTPERREFRPETDPRVSAWFWRSSSVLTIVCWWLGAMGGYTVPALVYLFAILLAAFRFSRGPMLFMAGIERAGMEFLFHSAAFTPSRSGSPRTSSCC